MYARRTIYLTGGSSREGTALKMRRMKTNGTPIINGRVRLVAFEQFQGMYDWCRRFLSHNWIVVRARGDENRR